MIKKLNILNFLIILFFISCSTESIKEEETLKLWYKQAASDWESEALPIGNAYMGSMFFGGVEKEQIQFSEATLWSGGPASSEEYNFGTKKGAWKHLAEIRRLLDEGKMDEAHQLANKELTGNNPKGDNAESSFGTYGAQQTMGDIFVEIEHKGKISNYVRELDITNSEGRVSYLAGENKYSRTYFASYPSKIMAYRFESDLESSYSISLETPHKKNAESFENSIYSYQGEVKDNGMQFETCLKIDSDGDVAFSDGKLKVKDATYLNIYHASETDYLNEYPTYKGNDFKGKNKSTLDKIAGRSFKDLQKEHWEDYKSLFNRVDLYLGGSKLDTIPTDVRLVSYSKGVKDLSLEVLHFQYGRYLMISGSRPGSMPLNLQGKWNNSTNPAWACDYHMNINQQMLYWPTELTNLSECHIPLFDYMETLVEPGKVTAQEFFNTRGWVVNTMNNPFGFTAPGWDFPWGFFPGGAAWLSQHLWEHYEFTQDEKYLKETALPMMKEAALFWIDYLVEDENGYLVSSPSYSPEHGGISSGASMDHQMAWDLLNNCVAAYEVLGFDDDFIKEAKNTRDKISPPSIGKWGQLQEWKEDVDDPENKHRHVSHMYAIYPGKQISIEETPTLAKAAAISLDARGIGSTGWSFAWKSNLWARLKDSKKAYSAYSKLLEPIAEKTGGRTYSNLFCAHPPFQLDGNMGAISAMVEMLLQSHTGTIELLPALPSEWKNGSVKGIKARGGFEVNIEWKEGTLVKAEIIASKDTSCKASYNGKEVEKDLSKGEKWVLTF